MKPKKIHRVGRLNLGEDEGVELELIACECGRANLHLLYNGNTTLEVSEPL